MLLPPDRRTLLTDLLRPPTGYALDRAVATTFTLEMDSLLTAPLAFAGHAIREENDQIPVMDAVRRCADRIDVFCQTGEIAVPRTTSSLLLLLESMVHPVARPRPGRLFHPKLWLVRYRGYEEPLLRLVVLSRNLTNSSSWDTGLRLDGTIGQRADETNRPVQRLLRHAMNSAVPAIGADRRAEIDGLLRDLGRAEWELPEGFRQLTFHALGVPGGGPGPDFSGSRHLIISPYLQVDGLDRCTPSGGLTLVSRQEALDRLPAEALDGCAVFVLDEMAVLDQDDEPDSRLRSGLHVKAYVAERGSRARVFLGSANATAAAFGGNVELLVELDGPRKEFGVDTMTGHDAPMRALLTEYVRLEAAEADDETAWELESYLLDLAAEPFTATVEGNQEPYDMRVLSALLPPGPEGASVELSLYTRPAEVFALNPGAPVDVPFHDLATTAITRFLILTATAADGTTRRTVVVAELTGDPADRLDRVLAEQIDTPEKFLRFLALLLGFGSAEEQRLLQDGSGSRATGGAGGTGVLELLLGALAERPAQLADLARLVARMAATEQGRSVLPDGFLALWTIVEQARQELADITA